MSRFSYANMVGAILVVQTVLFLCSATYVQAQIADIESMISSSIVAEPEFPSPGTKVTLRAKTQKFNLIGAMITWRINGEVVQESRGGISYTYTAREAGSVTRIDVTITSSDGKTVSSTYYQPVHDVAIAWEGETYVPPLFKGRPLHSPGSSIRLYTVAYVFKTDGTLYAPEELIYHWAYPGQTNAFASGVGLDSVITQNPESYVPLNVSLLIKDLTGKTLTVKRVSIPVTQPSILFYAADPLMGLQLQKALPDYYVIGSSELTIYAEPYHMVATSRSDQNLKYDWLVGSQTLSNPGSLLLRPEGSGSGRIELSIYNSAYWQQRVNKRLSLQFNSKNTTGEVTSSATIPL